MVTILALSSMIFANPCSAGPVLLYNASTGEVIYAEGANQPWFPASLAKLMTAYVVFDAWKTGKVVKTEKLVISVTAHRKPKLRLGLGVGQEITYEDAMSALVLLSANDIAVALAEDVAGSEELFVADMNAAATRLGMTGTHFTNASGLPGEGQFTTPKDLAILARALLRDFPQHMSIFSQLTALVGERTIASHNEILTSVVGGDGLKTGFTCSAGYNIVASATRGGIRLVVIVLGEQTKAKRNARAAALLERGFSGLATGTAVAAPTIELIPDEGFDAASVRASNLDKRFQACLDPDPLSAAADTNIGPGELKIASKAQQAVELQRNKLHRAQATRKQTKHHEMNGSVDDN